MQQLELLFQNRSVAIRREGMFTSPFLRTIYLIITIIIIPLIIATSSCSPSIDSEKSERTIVIDPEAAIRYQASLLFDSIQLIPLDTHSESVFAECRKLLISDDTYYIWDPEQKSILAFDKKGRFKFNTGGIRGRGPGEYQNIIDFDINMFTNNIEILEPFSRISVYSPDLSFVEYHHLPTELLPLQGFKIFTEDLYVFQAGLNAYNGNTLLFYSKARAMIVSTILELPPRLKGFPLFNPFSRFYFYNDSLYFTFSYINHASKICPQELTTSNSLSISFSGKTFRPEEIPESTNRSDRFNYTDNNSEKFAYVERIFESGKYCWIFFLFSDDYRYARYNKEDESLITAYGKFGEKYQLPPPHAFDEQSLYYVSSSSDLPLLVDPDLLDFKSLNVFNNIKEGDNPIIIRYYY